MLDHPTTFLERLLDKCLLLNCLKFILEEQRVWRSWKLGSLEAIDHHCNQELIAAGEAAMGRQKNKSVYSHAGRSPGGRNSISHCELVPTGRLTFNCILADNYISLQCIGLILWPNRWPLLNQMAHKSRIRKATGWDAGVADRDSK